MKFYALLLLAMLASFGSIRSRADVSPGAPVIDPVLKLPVVSLKAQRTSTTEPCITCRVAPGLYELQRTGPTNTTIEVYLRVDGTAQPDVDYVAVPEKVTMAPGEGSVSIFVGAVDDDLAEGPEVVRIQLEDPPFDFAPTYVIDPAAAEGFVTIFDNEEGAPATRLDLISPANGSTFAAGSSIELSALAVSAEQTPLGPVEFFDGNTLIGKSDPIFTIAVVTEGAPLVHTMKWAPTDPGAHTITARILVAENQFLLSRPITIVVGDNSKFPLVTIKAVNPIAEETSSPLKRIQCNGLVTLSREGALDLPLTVFLRYSGTATPGKDVIVLPTEVTFPAGSDSVSFGVIAVPDGLTEGIETLTVSLSACLTDPLALTKRECSQFRTVPPSDSATVFLRDDGVTTASIVVDQPLPAATYPEGSPVQLEATAIDLEGYISRVEFWIDDELAGVSQLEFFRAPDPGTPIHHSFEWAKATPGWHVLVARGGERKVESAPVKFQVGRDDSRPPKSSITWPTDGSVFALGQTVKITAEGVDSDGYITRVEFYDGEQRLSESNIEFFRKPDPGQLQTFEFEWQDPAPGVHKLGVIVTDDQGNAAASRQVEIVVDGGGNVPLVMVSALDAFGSEPNPNGAADPAVFELRRTGPLTSTFTVRYVLEGSAVNGVDYEKLPLEATFPAGVAGIKVEIRPIADSEPEGKETVVLRLEEPLSDISGAWRIGPQSKAMAIIGDAPLERPPVVGRLDPVDGKVVSVSFAASPGSDYQLEVSTDLRSWSTVGSVTATDASVQFVQDAPVDVPFRFYRLVPVAGQAKVP